MVRAGDLQTQDTILRVRPQVDRFVPLRFPIRFGIALVRAPGTRRRDRRTIASHARQWVVATPRTSSVPASSKDAPRSRNAATRSTGFAIACDGDETSGQCDSARTHA